MADVVELATRRGGLAGEVEDLVVQPQVELPRARAHGLQLFHRIIEETVLVPRRPRAGVAEEERADVVAVDPPGGEWSAGQRGERGQQVHRAGELVADRAG